MLKFMHFVEVETLPRHIDRVENLEWQQARERHDFIAFPDGLDSALGRRILPWLHLLIC